MLEKGLIGFLEENKKLLIFSFFVLIVMIIISVFILNYFRRKEELTPSPVYYPSVYPEESEEHFPLTEERCNSVKDQAQRKKCFNDLEYMRAVTSKEINKCLAIADKERIDDCIFYVVKLKSYDGTADPEDCEKIKEEEKKDSCIVNLAVNTFNYDICNRYFVNKPFERKECNDKVKTFDIVINKKDISLCGEVETLEYPALCYGYMFAQGKDCSELKEGPNKDFCESIYYLNEIKTSKDCNKLPLEDYRRVCIQMIKEQKPPSEMDSDRDGISDAEELNYRTDPFNPDTDKDGINDYHEAKVLKTNPLNPDTDGDGINDREEIKLGTDPNIVNY